VIAHERARTDARVVFHRASDPPTPGQPQHDRRLPRHDAHAALLAAKQTAKQPSELEIGDLDAPLIGSFLDYLEAERGNGVRTRNARLAAIRSLFRFAALRHPEHAHSIERVLAIPPKRFQRNLVTFLDEEELAALLGAPDGSTWIGRRDRVMLTLAAQTGLRASELTELGCADARLGAGAHVTCLGKGRKQRITPLTSATVALLRGWLTERGGQGQEPLFPNRDWSAQPRRPGTTAGQARRDRGGRLPVTG
jgi:integrase/recombinase XerD